MAQGACVFVLETKLKIASPDIPISPEALAIGIGSIHKGFK
jgi:hypothetical protein